MESQQLSQHSPISQIIILLSRYIDSLWIPVSCRRTFNTFSIRNIVACYNDCWDSIIDKAIMLGI